MSVFNKNLNGTIAPLIETNEKYIIKGQVFGKDDMKQEFLNFLPVNTTNTYHMPSLIRRCTVEVDTSTSYYYHSKKTRGDMYIIDNNDPAITYCIVDSAVLSDNVAKTRVLKIKTENNYTDIVWDVNFACTYLTNYIDNISYTATEILGQSDDYIIVLFARSSRQSYHNANRHNQVTVKKFNKVTGEYSNVFDYDTDRDITSSAMYGCSLKKIYETDSNIYMHFYNGLSNQITIYDTAPGQHSVFRFDKTTNQLIRLGSIAKDTDAAGEVMYNSQAIEYDGNLCYFMMTNVKKPKIMLIKIDTNNQAFVTETANVILNDKVDILPYMTEYTASRSTYMHTELFIKEYGGKKYLNIIGYSPYNAISETYFNRISTFLIDDNSLDLIAQDYCDPFKGFPIRGFVECVDNDLLLVSNRIAVKVLRFDVRQGKYVDIQTIDIPHKCFGCDSKNTIWISDTNNEIHKFSIDLPSEVRLSFEDDSFDYKGKDLKTNIIVEAINYLDERIELTLDLTIKGPMTFDDGSKATRITTEKDKAVKIPTIVNGSGIISVYPKIIL